MTGRGAILTCSLAAVLATGCGRDPTPLVRDPTPNMQVAPVYARDPVVGERATVERLVEADLYYRLVDLDTIVFKYTGGLIDCWIEEGLDGSPSPRQFRIGDEVRGQVTAAQAAGLPTHTGFVVVTRRSTDGQEKWDLRFTVDRPGQQPLGTTFADMAFGLRGPSRSVSKLEKPREVTGEMELMRVGARTPDGELTVRVKCAPWTAR